MYRHLKFSLEGRLARVLLDRPERRNAFSADLMREMIACAGELAAPLLEQRETSSLGGRMARAWEELPQVTVAAIEGYAIGGGLAFSVALDWCGMAGDAFVV